MCLPRSFLPTVCFTPPPARQASKESDVWAAGVLLYWMFRGRTPFPGARPEVRRAILDHEVDLAGIGDLDAFQLLRKIFRHERERRPSCAKLLLSRLCTRATAAASAVWAHDDPPSDDINS